MEVPAQVQLESHVHTGVQVRGGTNYDLSRSAAPTPLTRIVVVEPPAPVAPPPKNLDVTEYMPLDRMPTGEPKLQITFGRNSAVLPPSAVTAKAAKGVRTKPVIVAGHADAGEDDAEKLSKQRAEAVAKALRKFGVKPEVRSFGAERELTELPENRERNRRVEVFSGKAKP